MRKARLLARTVLRIATLQIGLAKTCQYGGLTILGVEGYKRLKDKFKRNKQQA